VLLFAGLIFRAVIGDIIGSRNGRFNALLLFAGLIFGAAVGSILQMEGFIPCNCLEG
jgi:hypothetical protein